MAAVTTRITVLKDLALSDDFEKRLRVVNDLKGNPEMIAKMPFDIIQNLAIDPHLEIRLGVVSNSEAVKRLHRITILAILRYDQFMVQCILFRNEDATRKLSDPELHSVLMPKFDAILRVFDRTKELPSPMITLTINCMKNADLMFRLPKDVVSRLKTAMDTINAPLNIAILEVLMRKGLITKVEGETNEALITRSLDMLEADPALLESVRTEVVEGARQLVILRRGRSH